MFKIDNFFYFALIDANAQAPRLKKKIWR